ncbi:hypothetical protein, partial [Vibrio rarus]
LILISSLLFSYSCLSASYKFVKKWDALVVNGDIDKQETRKFEYNYNLHHSNIRNIILQSHGGLIIDAFKLAKFISVRHLNTRVETYCESSCLLVFFSGESASLFEKAKISLHKPYKGNLNTHFEPDFKGSSLHYFLINELSHILNNTKMATALVNKMYETESNKEYILSKDELIKNGIYVDKKSWFNNRTK